MSGRRLTEIKPYVLEKPFYPETAPQVRMRPGFDPERVQRHYPWVLASDYDALLALYRDLKAKEAFHGF